MYRDLRSLVFWQRVFKQFYINEYTFFYSSLPKGGGGGVCVYVSEMLESSGMEVRLDGLLRNDGSYRGRWATGSFFLGGASYSVGVAGGVPRWLGGGDILLNLPPNSIVVGDINFGLNKDDEPDSFTLE